MNYPGLQRFSQLGLRWNPFRVAERSEIPQLYLPAPSESHLRADQIVCDDAPLTQIIASRGWGKSTLLAAVEQELILADIPCEFRYLRIEGPYDVKQPSSETDVLLIDEAQRLSRQPDAPRQTIRTPLLLGHQATNSLTQYLLLLY